MAITVYRQGDVAFIPVEKLPDGDKVQIRPLGRLIRRGEHGGRHEIEPGGQAEHLEITEREGQRPPTRRRFLQVLGSAVGGVLAGVGIVHGEHKRLELPPGNYEVRVQREEGEGTQRFVQD